MAIPTRPRRPLDPLAAAEAVFKPAATPPPPATTQDSSLPQPRELVSLRIDRGVLEHFQEGGPGWQDRINSALQQAVAADKGS